MSMHHPRVRATTLAVVVTCAAVGCSTTSPPRPQADPTPAPSFSSPVADPDVVEAERQARAAYAGYVQTWALALQTADPDSPDLARYVADPLLGEVRHNVRFIKDIGAVQIGAQTTTVLSVKVDPAANPPTVTINSCLDYRAIKLVYRSNQSPVPNATITDPTVSSVVTVWRYPTGQWLVNDSKPGSHPC